MSSLNPTHDPQLTSWVSSANDGNSDFPIQNLPHGIFRRAGSTEAWRKVASVNCRACHAASWLASAARHCSHAANT